MKILMENGVYLDVFGKGVIDVPNGNFHDVLCILDIRHNLLSIYQIEKDGKSIEFTPNSMFIWDLHSKQLVVVGGANHDAKIYKFSHFILDG